MVRGLRAVVRGRYRTVPGLSEQWPRRERADGEAPGEPGGDLDRLVLWLRDPRRVHDAR